MGLKEDIVESFLTRLSAYDNFPPATIGSIESLFNSSKLDEEALKKIIEEISDV